MIGTADEVRDFYNRYPYPPPLNSLNKYHHQWQDQERQRADFHIFWPNRLYKQDQSILIAGCGTSQAAKHALRWPQAQVTAIDCSATSVYYTEQLKKKHGLENLHVHQLDIEHVTDLGMSFDQVVCTGVLHHLANPDAGLSALRNVMKLDGAMHLMVYAPYGRAGIYMLQEFFRRIGIRPGNADVRDILSALSALPKGHPLQHLLTQAPELLNEAAIADSLLHPNDRAYSVPQLLNFIRKAELRFGRWIRQAPYRGDCGVMARIPQSAQIAQLPLSEVYAATELFRGTMTCHSLVVYRNDCASNVQPNTLIDEDCLNYVPLQMADTICIEEPLPPGAAAVLINRTHTYTDLFLPITPTERRLHDAIDGRRTLEDIARSTLLDDGKMALKVTQGFFDRLWRYDQVVFETMVQ
jgi:SAM-dependent methyltransferase